MTGHALLHSTASVNPKRWHLSHGVAAWVVCSNFLSSLLPFRRSFFVPLPPKINARFSLFLCSVFPKIRKNPKNLPSHLHAWSTLAKKLLSKFVLFVFGLYALAWIRVHFRFQSADPSAKIVTL
jgi:hypothetical protein